MATMVAITNEITAMVTSGQGTVSFCAKGDPKITEIPNQNAEADETFNYQVNCSSNCGEEISFYHSSIPSLNSFYINSSTGEINFIPSSDETGIYNFYIYCDKDGFEPNSEFFKLNVQSSFGPPVSTPSGGGGSGGGGSIITIINETIEDVINETIEDVINETIEDVINETIEDVIKDEKNQNQKIETNLVGVAWFTDKYVSNPSMFMLTLIVILVLILSLFTILIKYFSFKIIVQQPKKVKISEDYKVKIKIYNLQKKLYLWVAIFTEENYKLGNLTKPLIMSSLYSIEPIKKKIINLKNKLNNPGDYVFVTNYYFEKNKPSSKSIYTINTKFKVFSQIKKNKLNLFQFKKIWSLEREFELEQMDVERLELIKKKKEKRKRIRIKNRKRN